MISELWWMKRHENNYLRLQQDFWLVQAHLNNTRVKIIIIPILYFNIKVKLKKLKCEIAYLGKN